MRQMKGNYDGHNLTGPRAAMTSALITPLLNTLLFPLWNEHTAKTIDIYNDKKHHVDKIEKFRHVKASCR
ncbi:hypothetical protein [Photorhabdus luminescens]|uniref:hypothetical protein n=1 Tax=Photorhabdus luminescens TaxID=29488 RepID=UPI003BB76B0B